MVYLYWRWPGTHTDADGRPVTERRAPYGSLSDARGQADHDLALCKASDDYAAAPLRVLDDGGRVLWEATIPAGR
ncbi:hypothetical protein Ssi03_50410 [Sphaerisporangium siamense]|uniref:Uncharacterized protein n=1 Tax=Sphaerisporangium siamense TaxID=795645 RepID=A0A7W7D8I4_9ACTN|nr:hypothetical protein [Sphaerisporangium siamense]MBB4702255.1 hypothetical protein [Sphaerisporangium siamense]GII87051.1 hypothetical protein Ssi03_50410 [Sphaerisporangium siamense]